MLLAFNTLNMQGAITVTGNTETDGLSDNLYLANNKVITVTGSLAGSTIGVKMESVGGTFTKDYSVYNNYLPTAYFTSDNDMISVTLSSNEACLQEEVEGTVIALAGRNENGMRAIGPGEGNDDYGSLTIGDGMMVLNGDGTDGPYPASSRKAHCWYRTQARLEPCTHAHLTYTINGTGQNDTHTAHCTYCTTEFTAEGHTWDNGVCTLCGAGQTTYTVSIYLPDGNSYGDPTNYLMAVGNVFNLPPAPDANTPASMEFAGWLVADPTGITSFETDGNETLLVAGAEYTINGNVSFTARYRYINISLKDNASNGELLSLYNGKQVQSVTLNGRTLYKEGWNTICLPFAVDLTADGPLKGATAKTLSNVVNDGTTVTLTFGDAVESLEAGTPYIVKLPEEATENLVNPLFKGVTISNELNDVAAGDGTFMGTYTPVNWDAGTKNVLFLQVNKFYYPASAANVNAFRAYIQLNQDAPVSAGANIIIDFGDDASGIKTVDADAQQDGIWYTLQGIPLDSKPTEKGIYIVNGRKVAIQ